MEDWKEEGLQFSRPRTIRNRDYAVDLSFGLLR